MELSILMPCLNEAETVATCVTKARRFLTEHHVHGEVLVADNGSTDGSQEKAMWAGARVVCVDERGYGAALLGGIRAARGRYVVMADADDSYDFLALAPFLQKLQEGADLVMGNRFAGGIAPGAMPALHRYVGNPVLSFIGRLFFGSRIRDFHCGMRGFNRARIEALQLQSPGMEFASEMVVRATLAGYEVAEVPTTLGPDGRTRPPHLRSWRDGWRHLRFMLLYSPRWLFLLPGLALIALGLLIGVPTAWGPVHLGAITLDVDTLVAAAGMVVIGVQGVLFAVFTKVFAVSNGFLPPDRRVQRLQSIVTLERGLLCGGTLVLIGLAGCVLALVHWHGEGFGNLNPRNALRLVIPSAAALILGFELIFGSLFLSILGIPSRKRSAPDVVPAVADPMRVPEAGASLH